MLLIVKRKYLIKQKIFHMSQQMSLVQKCLHNCPFGGGGILLPISFMFWKKTKTISEIFGSLNAHISGGMSGCSNKLNSVFVEISQMLKDITQYPNIQIH